MTQRDQVVRTLQAHKPELAVTYGVRSLALFGSLASLKLRIRQQVEQDLVYVL